MYIRVHFIPFMKLMILRRTWDTQLDHWPHPCNPTRYVEPAYLYSAAYFRDGSLEQSTNSALRARLTGQYWEYSPSRAWNSEGVIHSPAMEAAWPVDRGEEEKEKHVHSPKAIQFPNNFLNMITLISCYVHSRFIANRRLYAGTNLW